MMCRVLVLVLCWTVAHGKGIAQAPVAESAADPSAEAEAKRLYAEGKVEYAQGRFVEAIALFERSYALSEAPGLLFNMAQAHRLAGADHCEEAVALYKSYLGALPAAENRREVEERIGELPPCAGRPQPVETAAEPLVQEPERPAKPPPAVPLPVSPAPAPRTRLAPILLGSAGAALLIAGGVLYARASNEYDQAERKCPCYPGTLDKWQRLTTVSYALMAG